ncbi:hypothetical protein F4780DRAFT_783292 [Xylariomycetidae sp. FL0641]|nr:hypothetical protein F4780DRAFT_783292 [Xylariomycetidae sp. FL0641]
MFSLPAEGHEPLMVPGNNELLGTIELCTSVDSNERRKAQNRVAQRNHRNKMKRRIEELEKRLDAQKQMPQVSMHERHGSATESMLPSPVVATLPTWPYNDLQAPFQPAPFDPSQAYSPVQDATQPYAYPPPLPGTPSSRYSIAASSMASSQSPPQQMMAPVDSNGLPAIPEPLRLSEDPVLPAYATPPTTAGSGSAGISSLEMIHNAPVEERIAMVLEFARSAGFDSFDALAAEYYTWKLEDTSSSTVTAAAAAGGQTPQHKGRNRGLRILLDQLGVDQQPNHHHQHQHHPHAWPNYEAHDYHNDISKAA